MIVIPWKEIPPETLDALLGEIVTRDGTDYGSVEKSTAQKVSAARNQLQGGYAVLVWNDETESAALISKEQAALLGVGRNQDTLVPESMD